MIICHCDLPCHIARQIYARHGGRLGDARTNSSCKSHFLRRFETDPGSFVRNLGIETGVGMACLAFPDISGVVVGSDDKLLFRDGGGCEPTAKSLTAPLSPATP